MLDWEGIQEQWDKDCDKFFKERYGEQMTNRETLLDWGYDPKLVESMSDEDCEGEVEAVEMYPEG